MSELSHYKVTFLTDKGDEVSVVVLGEDENSAIANAYRAYRASDSRWKVKQIEYLGRDIR